MAIYYILTRSGAVVAGRGVWGMDAMVCGLVGGCAGMAVGGLNLVRQELMALWQSERWGLARVEVDTSPLDSRRRGALRILALAL